MLLNEKKSQTMIFNTTQKYKFSTRILMRNTPMELVEETKLLGCIISSDLSWKSNTNMLVKKAYSRMIILHKLYSFNISVSDLILIYTLFIRSFLELNACVWHYSITQEERQDIERVQKTALRLILKDEYSTYSVALSTSNLESLDQRREKLCLKFAFKCLQQDKSKSMFPLNNNKVQDNLRSKEKFLAQHVNTSRLANSSIPQMQRALNKAISTKNKGQ